MKTRLLAALLAFAALPIYAQDEKPAETPAAPAKAAAEPAPEPDLGAPPPLPSEEALKSGADAAAKPEPPKSETKELSKMKPVKVPAAKAEADDAEPVADEAEAPEPVKPAPAKAKAVPAAAKAALPGIAPCPTAPAAAAPIKEAAPEPKAEAFVPAGAAAPYQTVVDAFGEAKDQFQQWVKDASAQSKELSDREEALKKDIQAKEAETTKLKLDKSKSAKEQVKTLAAETKQLWRDLDKIDSEQAALKRQLARSAANKVRELSNAIQQKQSQAEKAE